MKQEFNYFESQMLKRLAKGASALGAMLAVKRGRPAVNELVRLASILGRRTNLGLIKVIITYLATLHRLRRQNGLVFLVKTMKAWQVMLMQSLGGQRLHSLNPLGLRLARTKAGIPRVIPALHRARMRNGDIWTVRLWQSLFGLYRVLEIPGKLKISTITKPGTMLPDTLAEFSHFVTRHLVHVLKANFGSVPMVRTLGGLGPLGFMKTLKAKPFLMAKSGPAARRDSLESIKRQYSPLVTSPGAILAGAVLWYRSALYPILEGWCKMTGNIWMLNRIEMWGRTVLLQDVDSKGKTKDHQIGMLAPHGVGLGDGFIHPSDRHLGNKAEHVALTLGTLGRLGTSDEPAGKVRVFAMVDCFTQWIFDPLHRAIFDLLKSIPTDGTFDQLKPIHRLLRKRPQGPFYSYDLSAATDRLPLSLQKALLAPFLTSWGAEMWGTLLVGRPYDILYKGITDPGAEHLGGDMYRVHYEVGQPMGALSSWAMLAFTHHAIVQWAALRAGVTTIGSVKWFSDYALLGDDIVIANHRVAEAYKFLMNTLVGVEIGEHKSLVSINPRRRALEFAKRYFLNGKDASMVPFAEYWAAKGNLPASLELAKKYSMSLASYLTMLGYGYRAKGNVTKRLITLPSRIRNYVVSYYSPSGPGALHLRNWFALKRVFDLYIWTDAKIRSLVVAFFETEVAKLRDKLASLEPIEKWVRELVTVSRDRYHYAGKGRRPVERQTEFLDLSYDPGWNISAQVIDSIKETVFREAFLDTLSDIRDLRNTLEELDVNHLDWVEFEELLSSMMRITEALSLVPLPRELYKRNAGKPAFRMTFSWSELHAKYSRHFRSTQSA